MQANLSKHGTINLNRDRQILTRFQELKIRQTFPFLNLPPELRNMIYELCLDTKGIEKYFDCYYERIRKKDPEQKSKTLRCNKRTPSIFLVNRQIFSEAVGLLSKQSINFTHGLFSLGDVTKVVSHNVLQQVSSITITVHGHKILQPNILRESWSGYMDLLTQISTILSDGHNLKRLTIDFSDPDLTIHTTTCWDAGAGAYKCDFRDHMAEAFGNLRAIRGVKCVTLAGFPSALATELKARMESTPTSFLDLPAEIRKMIYAYSADASDVTARLDRFMRRWLDRTTPMPAYPARSTPTVLLLNKQITSEALPVIRSTPLHIIFPGSYDLPNQPQVPHITGFITPTSLQQIEHLSLHLERWEWIYSIEGLIATLGQNHNLKSFHFHLRDELKAKFLQNRTKFYPDKTLHNGLSGLGRIRGVKSVAIEGDLPDVWTAPLKEIMEGAIDAKSIPKLMAERVDGVLVDVESENY